MKVIYVANLAIAGWVGVSSLFYPRRAQSSVFANAFVFSESFRLVGALWTAIAILSLVGIFYPEKMSVVLLMQLIYKGSWLLFAALPAIIQGESYPKPMSIFFLVWIVVLPFFIPWSYLFS